MKPNSRSHFYPGILPLKPQSTSFPTSLRLHPKPWGHRESSHFVVGLESKPVVALVLRDQRIGSWAIEMGSVWPNPRIKMLGKNFAHEISKIRDTNLLRSTPYTLASPSLIMTHNVSLDSKCLNPNNQQKSFKRATATKMSGRIPEICVAFLGFCASPSVSRVLFESWCPEVVCGPVHCQGEV